MTSTPTTEALVQAIATIPRDAELRLANARLPACTVDGTGLPSAGDGLLAADLSLRDGRIAAVRAPGATPGDGPVIDLEQAMVWPCPVDCHTHLDKGQTWARSANGDGSFDGATAAAHADRQRRHEPDDILQRAEFQLRSAYAHGTAALRSHVDAGDDGAATGFAVLSELAEDWRGRLAVQIAPFGGVEDPPERTERNALAARHRHSGVLSSFLIMCPGLDAYLDRTIALADKYGLALDFHADENLDPGSHCLRAIAEAVLRNRFAGPVLVGHCCSLAAQSEDDLDRTLDLVAEAGLTIVSLPLCNLYLMDRRSAASPRLRGFAPVHEMRARGIGVAIASDNVRDAFHAYGDLDGLELFRDAMRTMHLDHPVGDWPATVTGAAARAMGLTQAGRIDAGLPADLIIVAARNWSEFAARAVNDRIVLRGGAAVDTTPPPFAELDDLEGMTS